ncbi:MAG: hypothetical protein JXA14_26610 [Anaerolineae bacterium]|nr:hypothetical protein [Anaerolineae bacterium]
MMYREDRLVIRLSDAERAAIERLAQAERLPASTLARSMLLQEVDRRGLWPSKSGEKPGQGGVPTPPLWPAFQGGNPTEGGVTDIGPCHGRGSRRGRG